MVFPSRISTVHRTELFFCHFLHHCSLLSSSYPVSSSCSTPWVDPSVPHLWHKAPVPQPVEPSRSSISCKSTPRVPFSYFLDVIYQTVPPPLRITCQGFLWRAAWLFYIHTAFHFHQTETPFLDNRKSYTFKSFLCIKTFNKCSSQGSWKYLEKYKRERFSWTPNSANEQLGRSSK